ncbi:hypothetical protein FPCIR_5219 [Fusarium pseudocircinatum]|uniref:Uncharacterized protein n=1 Tax=Fusarium pseudocircinatum TaxID=56676 RepID=A0A8H5PBB8_9HYPO|nr:hypothetical protein FPCIR_5219 [Fusarium pseudocircinatum]
MSIASAVIADLEDYENDHKQGLARLGHVNFSCLGHALAVHKSSRLVCVIDDNETCCALCTHNHKRCTAVSSASRLRNHSRPNADPLQLWRVVQFLNDLGSALCSLVLTNPCGTSSDNPLGIALVLQVQELASIREYLSLIYRAQAGGEQHNSEEIQDNISRLTLGYTRECVEVGVFTRALDGLPLAFRDPLENEKPRKKADWLDKLPAGFLTVMQRYVDAGDPNPTPCIVVRFAGQGVSHRESTQGHSPAPSPSIGRPKVYPKDPKT